MFQSRSGPPKGLGVRAVALGAEERRGSEETTFLIKLVDWKLGFVKNYTGYEFQFQRMRARKKQAVNKG